MTLRLHAICLALNEELFLSEQLAFLYGLCDGVSVLTQYDRDYRGTRLAPDSTVARVLAHDDPEGKLHLVVRRWRDETVARNHEMLALLTEPHRGVDPHDATRAALAAQHRPPDYFMIVDADDFFDAERIGGVLEYLEAKRPRGLRMHFRNYIGTWNTYLEPESAPTCSFVFVRHDVRFERWRLPSLRELAWSGFRYNVPRHRWSRLQRVLARSRLSRAVERGYGFDTCPPEIGVVHHGQWIGTRERVLAKLAKSGNRLHHDPRFLKILENKPVRWVATADLPRNIREGDWPPGLLEGR